MNCSYKEAFPDFDDSLPSISGWEDTSYKNDICPSIGYNFYESPHLSLWAKIWVDYKDPEKREWPDNPRYSFAIENILGNHDSILETDSWAEILQAVDKWLAEYEMENCSCCRNKTPVCIQSHVLLIDGEVFRVCYDCTHQSLDYILRTIIKNKREGME